MVMNFSDGASVFFVYVADKVKTLFEVGKTSESPFTAKCLI